jgi:hypothetical protein
MCFTVTKKNTFVGQLWLTKASGELLITPTVYLKYNYGAERECPLIGTVIASRADKGAAAYKWARVLCPAARLCKWRTHTHL